MFGRILFVVVAIVSFTVDRITKIMVEHRLDLGERVHVIGDVLQLVYVRNRGIAFGFFSDSGSIVVAGTLVVGVLLFVFMLQVQPDDLLTILGGALITGGALGNLYDRVSYRYVIDFIHTPNFPTFNVADISITLGVVAVILAQLIQLRRELHEAKDPES
ncbi:MAG: signal peptidase II [Gaiellales bacterium]